jgi:hypothetical protein
VAEVGGGVFGSTVTGSKVWRPAWGAPRTPPRKQVALDFNSESGEYTHPPKCLEPWGEHFKGKSIPTHGGSPKEITLGGDGASVDMPSNMNKFPDWVAFGI